MKKSNLRFLFLVILLADASFSFIQYYHHSLDGDIASIILGYPEVRHDPFGLSVLLENKVYGGTNRFFAHWMMSSYFKSVPFIFQQFTSPVESIYVSCALAKTLMQIFIIWLLACIISGTRNILNQKFLVAAILITSLFQTEGFSRRMSVVSSSITYAFFYALPACLMLLFFLPFYKRIMSEEWEKLKIVKSIFLLLFSVVLSLDGPLNTAVILIGCFLIIASMMMKTFNETLSTSFLQNSFLSFKKIPKQLLFFFGFICLLSLYSIYIGRNNAENFFHSIPLSERYSRLPVGLFYLFTLKLGMPLLLAMIILNVYLISREAQNAEGKKIITQLKWIGLFALIYILILPLGGYREYRENIVRGDTFLPVLLCMFYFFGISTLHLLNRSHSKFNLFYNGVVVAVLLIFTIADKSVSKENECEKAALEKIAQSSEKIVHLNADCTVMSWYKITDFNNSKLNSQLLQYWGVIKEEKLYYQD